MSKMTEPKILTPQEALRALADEQKLSCIGYESYIWLDRGVIVWSGGHTYKGDFNNLTEYYEPNPKVVWVEYLATPTHTGTQSGGAYFFREDDIPNNSMWRYTPTGRKIEV